MNEEEELELKKVTFLRLYPQYNFNEVDNILNEIQNNKKKKKRNNNEINKKRNITTQTNDNDNNNNNNNNNSNNNSNSDNIDDYYNQQRKNFEFNNDFNFNLSYISTFQYENESEFVHLIGQLGAKDLINNERKKEKKIETELESKLDTNHLIKESNLNESIETEQMRRLGEIIEWRKSLLNK